MITVKENPAKESTFEAGSLYKSNMFHKNGNIYLIIGPGSTPRHIAAVRLAGSSFQYSDDILKTCLLPFNGEVIISNGDK